MTVWWRYGDGMVTVWWRYGDGMVVTAWWQYCHMYIYMGFWRLDDVGTMSWRWDLMVNNNSLESAMSIWGTTLWLKCPHVGTLTVNSLHVLRFVDKTWWKWLACHDCLPFHPQISFPALFCFLLAWYTTSTTRRRRIITLYGLASYHIPLTRTSTVSLLVLH